uniref:Uncharacterized protein n=1 Tax=Arundo donax TaxID=35708 RepID=A0A0A9GVX4_ARUDO
MLWTCSSFIMWTIPSALNNRYSLSLFTTTQNTQPFAFSLFFLPSIHNRRQ